MKNALASHRGLTTVSREKKNLDPAIKSSPFAYVSGSTPCVGRHSGRPFGGSGGHMVESKRRAEFLPTLPAHEEARATSNAKHGRLFHIFRARVSERTSARGYIVIRLAVLNVIIRCRCGARKKSRFAGRRPRAVIRGETLLASLAARNVRGSFLSQPAPQECGGRPAANAPDCVRFLVGPIGLRSPNPRLWPD